MIILFLATVIGLVLWVAFEEGWGGSGYTNGANGYDLCDLPMAGAWKSLQNVHDWAACSAVACMGDDDRLSQSMDDDLRYSPIYAYMPQNIHHWSYIEDQNRMAESTDSYSSSSIFDNDDWINSSSDDCGGLSSLWDDWSSDASSPLDDSWSMSSSFDD